MISIKHASFKKKNRCGSLAHLNRIHGHNMTDSYEQNNYSGTSTLISTSANTTQNYSKPNNKPNNEHKYVTPDYTKYQKK